MKICRCDIPVQYGYRIFSIIALIISKRVQCSTKNIARPCSTDWMTKLRRDTRLCRRKKNCFIKTTQRKTMYNEINWWIEMFFRSDFQRLLSALKLARKKEPMQGRRYREWAQLEKIGIPLVKNIIFSPSCKTFFYSMISR